MEAVRMVVMCQQLNCLPRPGGLFDQDARLMTIFRYVFDAQSERAKRDEDRRINERRAGRG